MPTPDIVINTKARDFLTKEFAKIRSELQKTGKKGRKDFENLNKAAKDFNKTLTAGKALLAGFISIKAAKAVTGQITAVADLGEEYSVLSQQLGVSSEFLSEVGFAAEVNRVKFNEFAIGIQRAIRRFEEFRSTGRGVAGEAFKILGDDLADAVRRGESFERILPRLADRFDSLDSSQKRVLAGFKLFDSEGVKLIRLFADGSEGIERLRKEARELGLSFDRDAVAKTAAFNEELLKFQSALAGIRNEIVLEFLPSITSGLRDLRQFISGNREEILGFLRRVAEGGIDVGLAILNVTRSIQESANVVDRISSPIESFAAFFAQRPFFSFGDKVPGNIQVLDDLIKTLGDAKNALRFQPAASEAKKDLDELDEAAGGLRDSIARLNETMEQFGVVKSPRLLGLTESERAARANQLAAIDQLRARNAEVEDIFETTHQREVERGKEEKAQRQQAVAAAEQLARVDPLAGLSKGLDESRKRSLELGEQVRVAFHQVEESVASSATSEIIAFAEGTKSAKEAFADFAKSVISDLARIAIRATILNAIGGIASSFGPTQAGDGGIVPGRLQPVAGLAGGGVVRRRGLFELAERGQPEAVVPLPDGRAIPVKPVGPRAGGAALPPTVVEQHNPFNLQFPNMRTAQDAKESAEFITATVLRRLKESSSFNSAVNAA